jgi:hypothetical protein
MSALLGLVVAIPEEPFDHRHRRFRHPGDKRHIDPRLVEVGGFSRSVSDSHRSARSDGGSAGWSSPG